MSSVPYFHAKECNPDPGNGVFSGLTKQERIGFQTRMIQRVKQYSEYGFAVALNEQDFIASGLQHQTTFKRSAYSFLLWTCMSAVQT